MADHVMRTWAPRALRLVAAVVLGAAAAAAGVWLAVISFDWSSWAPAVVSLVMIVVGGVLYRRAEEVIIKGLALGLIVGAFITVLLWPLFAVDTGGDLENRP